MEKFFLYLSAFVPMYFLLAIKLIIDIAFGNLTFNILNSISLALFVLLFVLGIIGIVLIFKKIECNATTIEIIDIRNKTDSQFFSYFSLFVLFSLSYQIEFVSMFCVFVIIVVFIGLVYIRNNLFGINPLLNILGYSYYEVSYLDKNKKQHAACVFHKGKLTKKVCRYCINQKLDGFALIK